MKTETVLVEKKERKKLSPEDKEFVDGFVRSLEDIKHGRIRRVA